MLTSSWMKHLTMAYCSYILISIIISTKQTLVTGAGYADFDNICNKLWQEDRNGLTMGRDYQVNIQSKIYDPSLNKDKASLPLFDFVDHHALDKPTFKAFRALLDNYDRFVGTTEDMTSDEKSETWAFLDEISKTGPVKELHQYLVGNGMAPSSMNDFLWELYKMWFYRYQRKSYRDSSGFEHVFVGEISRGAVSGFHNWLQFYYLEQTQQLDYRGYMKYSYTEPVSLKLQLFWGGYKKKITSVFLGTSPEFDLAIYTLCFMVFPGKSCRCNVNGSDIPIVTYPYKGSTYLIGTAYVRI